MTNQTMTNNGGKPDNGKTRIEIYTDGACQGNPGPGGWGFVALLLDEANAIIAKEERSGAAEGITTNNRAEMEAALNALAFIAEQQESGAWPFCPVTLVSDSQYLVKGFTEWLPNWEARGWRKSGGKAPDNRDLWVRLKGAAEGRAVRWQWVRGHNGNRWNERADVLATNGVEQAVRLGVTFRQSSE